MHINDDISVLKKKLRELAEVVNAFKSEAVQLKIVELLFERSEELLESGAEVQKPPKEKKKKIKKVGPKDLYFVGYFHYLKTYI